MDYTLHPLVSREEFRANDIRLEELQYMEGSSSGVCVFCVNNLCDELPTLMAKSWVNEYRIEGILSRETLKHEIKERVTLKTDYDTKSMKKKKQSKENKGSHENVDVDPEDFKEVKKRGALGNLYLKVVGIESTQLEQAFVESMNQHEEYRSQLNKLFTAAELILQPNFLLVNAGKLNEDAFVVKEGSRSFTPYTHPMQRVANHIQALAPFMKPSHGKPDFLSPSDRHILNTLPSRCMDMMDIEKKSRTKTRSLMNRTRLFLSKDMQEFKNNKEEVENHLMIMDDMRNQVKKAKTKAELEKAGKGYAAAVYEFNRRADLIDRVLESHTENVYFHQRDLSRMFGERAKFHFDMMKILQEFDLDVVAVEQRKK